MFNVMVEVEAFLIVINRSEDGVNDEVSATHYARRNIVTRMMEFGYIIGARNNQLAINLRILCMIRDALITTLRVMLNQEDGTEDILIRANDLLTRLNIGPCDPPILPFLLPIPPRFQTQIPIQETAPYNAQGGRKRKSKKQRKSRKQRKSKKHSKK
jgi:hypothetical protein